jgi:luciferase family oxidoreductase group 1
VGRAPGSVALPQRALRRHPTSAERFPEDVQELLAWFRGDASTRVQAVPGAGLQVPLWILGSSLFGASLAAELGLPYAFASHFAPAELEPALALYRARFRPSEQLQRPYVMLGLNVIAAESDAQARLLLSSLQQAFVALRRGRPRQLPPPQADYERSMTEGERVLLAQALSCSVVGSPESVRRGLLEFSARTGADELIITAQIYDHAARLRSFEIAAEAGRALVGSAPASAL